MTSNWASRPRRRVISTQPEGREIPLSIRRLPTTPRCSGLVGRPSPSWPGIVSARTISRMPNLTSALNLLQQERNRLTSQLESLSNAISALNGTGGARKTLSTAGRARIVAAQRARWAKAKGQKVVSIAARKRHRLSASALANIRAAQKARWDKWRRAQKKR